MGRKEPAGIIRFCWRTGENRYGLVGGLYGPIGSIWVMDYQVLMRQALGLAQKAFVEGEVPVGALVVSESGEIISEAHNTRERDCSALAHAEVLAIQLASEKLGKWRLSDCTLITTLEPCVMCSGALIQARIGRVVYGASDPKGGGQSLFQLLEEPRLNHRPELITGVLSEECGQLLKEFFKQRR